MNIRLAEMCAYGGSTVNVYKKLWKKKNRSALFAESEMDILPDLIRLFKWNLSGVVFYLLCRVILIQYICWTLQIRDFFPNLKATVWASFEDQNIK